MSIRCVNATSVADNPNGPNPTTPTVVADRPITPDVIIAFDENEEDLFFEQYDGDFTYPLNAFYAPGDGLGYLVQTASGFNRVTGSFSFLGIRHDHLAGTIPIPPGTDIAGVFASAWSGASTYNPNTDTYSGGIIVTVEEAGVLPAGGNYLRFARDIFQFTAVSVDAAFIELFANGGFFAARTVIGSNRQGIDSLISYFSNTPPPIRGGYFAGGPMGMIWVDGYGMTVSYSVPISASALGVPIARTGTPARTQHLLTYNTTTKVKTGTISRLRKIVAIPTGKTTLFGDFTFLVTPTNGDDPYYLYVTKEYTVTPNTQYEAIYEFPSIIGATVYYVSGMFTYTPSIFQGYSSYAADEYVNLGASANWPLVTTYGLSARSASFEIDFEDMNEGPTLVIDSGRGWFDSGSFLNGDREDFHDDFQSYTVGEIFLLAGGYAFVGMGTLVFYVIVDFYTDFEADAIGVITSQGTTSDGAFTADGTFVETVTYDFDDSFESYGTGIITSVSGGNGYWTAAGSFV